MQITKRGNQMSRVRKTVVQLAVFVALLVSSGMARADELALVIIDFSGSMVGLSDATNTKMTIAKQRATEFLTTAAPGRKYSVWLFFNDSLSGTSIYTPVVTFLENKTGAQASTALDMALTSMGGNPPGGNLTPLAGSMCAAMRELITSAGTDPNINRHLYTISDGLENSTPTNPDPALDCSGFNSVGVFNDALPNAGLDVGSWQWKVRNMAVNGAANNSSDGPPPTHQILDIDYLREWVPTAPLMMARQAVTLDHQASVPQVAISTSKANPSASAPPPEDPLITFYKGMTKLTGGRFQDIGGLEVPLPHILGDLNNNGCVNAVDVVILAKSLGKHVTGDNPADINRDGKVDHIDSRILLSNLNKGPNCPCKN
jgi:hypothetical protein